jgi:hypothetical protein
VDINKLSNNWQIYLLDHNKLDYGFNFNDLIFHAAEVMNMQSLSLTDVLILVFTNKEYVLGSYINRNLICNIIDGLYTKESLSHEISKELYLETKLNDYYEDHKDTKNISENIKQIAIHNHHMLSYEESDDDISINCVESVPAGLLNGISIRYQFPVLKHINDIISDMLIHGYKKCIECEYYITGFCRENILNKKEVCELFQKSECVGD